MRHMITITGQKLDGMIARGARIVVTRMADYLRNLFLDARFLLRWLAPEAAAQRVAVSSHCHSAAPGTKRGWKSRVGVTRSVRTVRPAGGPRSERVSGWF
ncbi:MAG: hypothetical protein JW818_06495 [Pirellulales bacterium]|nr:hypothetical protein [Pirellulales bacterium]